MPSIQIKYPALTLKAGARALQHIRRNGLKAEDIGTVPGAAGGPKAIGIQGLDLAVFGDWLPRAPRERALIGASIGSWRFACVCRPDPAAALQQLGELYTEMHFGKKATSREVSQGSMEMLRQLLAGEENRILDNPGYHLNILVVKCLGRLASDNRTAIALGLASVIRDNLLGRQRLGRHFERLIVHDARRQPPLTMPLTDFPSHLIPLRKDNLCPALMASASIPLVMDAVHALPGEGEGAFRDGGLLDYHLDLPYDAADLVLYPHFTDKIVPGWFDKTLPWRQQGEATHLQNVLLLAPSHEYLEKLPHGKLPDRTDYKRYLGNDPGRKRYWRQAMSESRRLGDAFLELIEKQQLPAAINPLFGK